MRKTTASPNLTPPIRAALRRQLLTWYAAHQRRLPWRAAAGRPVDPYHVLVSEAMLQQTQVATVRTYFQRFIAQFPTLPSLAAADEQDVLRLWQGLGYYRRARHLHAAAQAIVANHGGKIPSAPAQLRQLPGVGPYTAGAIASIAFQQRAPLVDGNVARVLARWLAVADPVDRADVRRRLWAVAEELVPAEAPGDFNQALMELGALICLPRNPGCTECPLANLCQARRQNLAARLPVLLKRRAPHPVTHHVLVIHRAHLYLLEQRPATGLWSKMWQFPTFEEPPPTIAAAWLRQRGRERWNLALAPPVRIGQFRHQTTHRTIQFVVWCATATAGRLRRGTGLWRKLSNLHNLPMANPQRKVRAMLEDKPQ